MSCRETIRELGDVVTGATDKPYFAEAGSYRPTLDKLQNDYRCLKLIIVPFCFQRGKDFPEHFQIYALGRWMGSIREDDENRAYMKPVDVDEVSVRSATWNLWKRKRLVAMVEDCQQRLYDDRMTES